MAALPLTQKGVDVNLPLDVKSTQQPRDPQTQVIAEYTAERVINVNKVPVPAADLSNYLRNMFDGRADKTLFIVGAPTLKYSEVMSVIDAGVGAGAKVALITEGMRKEAAAR
jgi:biopolymer transport protein ExbD